MKKWLVPLLVAVMLAGCAGGPPRKSSEPNPRDPWESYNRRVFQFNRKVDTIFWRPLAKAYDSLVPDPFQQGISNFFTNLGYPIDIVNLLLQGRPADSGKALGRFALNSTIGVLGLFDVASRADIPQYEEDFGQTLAVWGWTDSRYFVVPFFGGTTISDAVGYVPDYYTNVVWNSIEEDKVRYGLAALDVIQLRAQLLSQEQTIKEAFDPYILFRDSYLQRRDYLIHNGETELPDYDSLIEETSDGN